MLRAKLKGKLVDGAIREDALTAIVLSRLSYLPPTLARNVIIGGLREYPLQDVRAVERLFTKSAAAAPFALHLWPRLEAASGGGQVEPDAVIEIGNSVLVVEAKQSGLGGNQRLGQIEREIGAVMQVRKRLGANREEQFAALLIEPPPSRDLASWSVRLERRGIEVFALRWSDLADAVLAAARSPAVASHERAVLTDILAGLGAARVHAILPLASLPPEAFTDIPHWFTNLE